MKRTGTSLSLSENEMDSDIEVDLTLAIKQHQKSSRSTPQSPENVTNIMHTIDNIDGYARTNSVPLTMDSIQNAPHQTLDYLNSRSSSIASQEIGEKNKSESEIENENEHEHEELDKKSTIETLSSS